MVTREKAEAFAAEFKKNVAHTVWSCALEVGLHPRTAHDCIGRFDRGQSTSEEDEECGRIMALARAKHLMQLREVGQTLGESGNGPAVAWFKWRLETQAPLEHPRKTEMELTGKDGGPIQTLAVDKLSDAELDAKIAAAAKLGGGGDVDE